MVVEGLLSIWEGLCLKATVSFRERKTTEITEELGDSQKPIAPIPLKIGAWKIIFSFLGWHSVLVSG